MENEKVKSWSVYAASLATAFGFVYVFCSVFDAIYPGPFGVIRWLAPASPWAITGSVTGFITGLIMFIVAGFFLGTLYRIAWSFWSKRLN